MIWLDVNIANKCYSGGLNVLDNVRFKADSGEFIAIVGPSGAGKTTLLNILAGIDTEFEGSVIAGSEHELTPKNLNIGFMFQQAGLMPWLTVLENVMLVTGKLHKNKQPGSNNKASQAKELIQQVGLAGFENRFPRQLSGGMQKRASLARAFAVQPQLLLLDEPFQSLDHPTAERFRGQLMNLWDSNKQTVLLVTHELREAISLADRILFMSDRPATILLDFAVNLKRPRTINSAEVSELFNLVIADHPDILSGRL